MTVALWLAIAYAQVAALIVSHRAGAAKMKTACIRSLLAANCATNARL
jgi:hypothetical protein